MPLCAYVGWRSENQRLLPLPLFTLAFKLPESASDIQLPTPLSFITQFATGGMMCLSTVYSFGP